jgi:hypothetical protein
MATKEYAAALKPLSSFTCAAVSGADRKGDGR